ncbi:MAG: enoyl-CoA hydratase/isomerase family protein [Candidatus Heimdallarchaeaceae archaeon]|jgi:enoyl-CoA hydratase
MLENEDSILLEKTGEKERIALITLNRQKALNSLNEEMLDSLEEIFTNLREDSDVRVVVISAEGKGWCTGADLKWMQSLGTEADLLIKKGQRVIEIIENHPFPVIAAITGYTLGGGLELALVCDIRLASENAVFGLPETTIGLLPGWGANYRLPKVVGLGKAKELILTGRRFAADEALQMNLIDRIYPPEQLKDEAIKIAETIADNAPIAIKKAKEALNKSVYASLEEGYETELQGTKDCFNSEDIKEGISAIFEKRKPNFKGE